MKDSCTRILLLGIIISIKTGYSYQIEDKEERRLPLKGFTDGDESLLYDDEAPHFLALREPEEAFIRQTRAGYLFRTRKDPNKKDRMYLFRTKKDNDEEEVGNTGLLNMDSAEEEVQLRERRDGSNLYFRTRKFEDHTQPRGGYYFRTRKSDWMDPSPISMRGYFLRTRKDPGTSSYWFRNRRDSNGQDDGYIDQLSKRGYFFRTRKLTDWDNFERNLRGRSYFLRT